MKAVFLSDVHLKGDDDVRHHHIVNFLDHLKGYNCIDDLFLVGDFFDFWFCRNTTIHPGFASVVGKLVELQQQGSRIHLCEGNHDFFLKDYFADTLGMSVFSEWADVKLDERRVLISHGDTVDRTNSRYLFLRKVLRSRFFYVLQKRIPLSVLWRVARFSSTMSKELLPESEDLIAEKMEVFALEMFQEGYDDVILGHCHKPLLKEYVIGGRRRTFATLGDWIRHRSYLSYEDGRYVLSFYERTFMHGGGNGK